MDIPVYITISTRSSVLHVDSGESSQEVTAAIKQSRSTDLLNESYKYSSYTTAAPLRRTASLECDPSQYRTIRKVNGRMKRRNTVQLPAVDLKPKLPLRSPESCSCPPRLPKRQGSFGSVFSHSSTEEKSQRKCNHKYSTATSRNCT